MCWRQNIIISKKSLFSYVGLLYGSVSICFQVYFDGFLFAHALKRHLKNAMWCVGARTLYPKKRPKYLWKYTCKETQILIEIHMERDPYKRPTYGKMIFRNIMSHSWNVISFQSNDISRMRHDISEYQEESLFPYIGLLYGSVLIYIQVSSYGFLFAYELKWQFKNTTWCFGISRDPYKRPLVYGMSCRILMLLVKRPIQESLIKRPTSRRMRHDIPYGMSYMECMSLLKIYVLKIHVSLQNIGLFCRALLH